MSASLVTYFLSLFVAVGYFLFVAQYLQLVLGLSPLEAGLWSLPSAAGFTIGSTVGPRILNRYRPALVMAGGLVLAAIGMASSWGSGESSGLTVVVIGSIIISLGLAPVITLATELIVGSAPPEKAGAASGISETGGELGGALGLAILGSIGTAVYRRTLGSTLPAGLPAEAAAAARDTLGGAVGVAAELPEERRCRPARGSPPGFHQRAPGHGRHQRRPFDRGRDRRLDPAAERAARPETVGETRRGEPDERGEVAEAGRLPAAR